MWGEGGERLGERERERRGAEREREREREGGWVDVRVRGWVDAG